MFENIFEIFRDFQNFHFSDFSRKSRNFQRFLMIFFAKLFKFQSYLNNVATLMLLNKKKHKIFKQTCGTLKIAIYLEIPGFVGGQDRDRSHVLIHFENRFLCLAALCFDRHFSHHGF